MNVRQDRFLVDASLLGELVETPPAFLLEFFDILPNSHFDVVCRCGPASRTFHCFAAVPIRRRFHLIRLNCTCSNNAADANDAWRRGFPRLTHEEFDGNLAALLLQALPLIIGFALLFDL